MGRGERQRWPCFFGKEGRKGKTYAFISRDPALPLAPGTFLNTESWEGWRSRKGVWGTWVDVGGRGSPAPQAGRCQQTKSLDAPCWQLEGQQSQAPQLTSGGGEGVTSLSLGNLALSRDTDSSPLNPFFLASLATAKRRET